MAPLQKRALCGLVIGICLAAAILAIFLLKGGISRFDIDKGFRLIIDALWIAGLVIAFSVLLVLLIFALVWLRMRGRWSRGWSFFTLVLGALIVHTFFNMAFINWPYVWNTYYAVFKMVQRLWPLAIVGALSLVAIVVFGIRQRAKFTKSSTRLVRLFRLLLIVVLVGLGIYAYFVRPVVEPAQVFTACPGNVEVPSLNSQSRQHGRQ